MRPKSLRKVAAFKRLAGLVQAVETMHIWLHKIIPSEPGKYEHYSISPLIPISTIGRVELDATDGVATTLLERGGMRI